MDRSYRPLIAIDLDGTLLEDGHWPILGPLKPGAYKYNKMLLRDNDLIIYTARLNQYDMEHRLRSNTEMARELNSIRTLLNDNDLDKIRIWTGQDCKPSANAFIDDRNVEFTDSWRRAYHKTRVKLGQDTNIRR